MTRTTSIDSAAARLRAAAERFRHQISPWTPARFAAPASGGVPPELISDAPPASGDARGAGPAGPSRGDVVHRLVQVLADLAADAEGQPRRRVPRLAADTSLPDQLAVLVADLLAARALDGGALDGALDKAAAAIAATSRSL